MIPTANETMRLPTKEDYKMSGTMTYVYDGPTISSDIINKTIKRIQNNPIDIFQEIAVKRGFDLDKGDMMVLPSNIAPKTLRNNVTASKNTDSILLFSRHWLGTDYNEALKIEV